MVYVLLQVDTTHQYQHRSLNVFSIKASLIHVLPFVF